MGITLRINGVDFGDRLSTYNVRREVSYSRVIKMLSGLEKGLNKTQRVVVTFSLIPYTDERSKADFEALSANELCVTFTDSENNIESHRNMRVVSNLEDTFLLDSIDGNRYYKGGRIQLRSTTVD